MAIINNYEKFGELVISTVKKHNGMKLHDLIRVYENTQDIDRQNMEEFIESLVREHKLIQVEYTIDMSTVGAFLLPPSTRTNIRGVLPSPPKRI